MFGSHSVTSNPRRSGYWTFGWIGLLGFLSVALPSLASAQSATATLRSANATTNTTTTTVVYGPTACSGNTQLSMSWILDLGTSRVFDSNALIRVKLVLTNKDGQDVTIAEQATVRAPALPETPGVAGTANFYANNQKVEGTWENIQLLGTFDRTALGFTNDSTLDVKDLIGYDKTVNGTGVTGDICDKLPPSTDSGERTISVKVKFEYAYRGLSTNQANIEVPETTVQTDKTVETNASIEYDLTPPNAPTIRLGDATSTAVSLTLEGATNYTIYFRGISDGSSTPDTADDVASCDDAIKLFNSANVKTAEYSKRTVNGNETGSTSTNLDNLTLGLFYLITASGTDSAGNESAVAADVKCIKTQPTVDFYSTYSSVGGKNKGFESGGYCFLATATYGSYTHGWVRVLRQFRDRFLLTNSWGKSFVVWYYRNSPPWAKWLQESPKARFASKILLAPVVFAAFLFLNPLWLLLLMLLGLGFWRWRKYAKKATVAAALGCMIALAPSLSQADVGTEAGNKIESPRNFGLEIRVGPYRPDSIDNKISENCPSSITNRELCKPYQYNFGAYYQPVIALGFEWLVFKKFGSIGIGGSVGVSWATGPIRDQSGNVITKEQTTTNTDGTQTTETVNVTQTAYVIPIRLDISYRLDYFALNYGVPLVPYIRGGINYSLFFVTNGDGDISSTTDGNYAFSGNIGFHFALGLQLQLDFIDPVAARTFDVEVGVNHTYLFVEWSFSWVGQFTENAYDLSNSMVRGGLMVQF